MPLLSVLARFALARGLRGLPRRLARAPSTGSRKEPGPGTS
jgi:hypothetical protein